MTNGSSTLRQELYEKQQTIHPRQVSGLFARLRVTAVLVLLGLYYFIPWVPWEGRQAVLFDLPARQFYLFGMVLWPQDFIYLSGLLIIAALSLFFFTTIAGRLWCGYACPQTVWTEVFLWIERHIEGDRNQRIKLDKAPISLRKVRLKFAKHAIWILLSLWTGFTFVGYFTPILELGDKILTGAVGFWEGFWVLFYGMATYGNAGWLREQVCIYMCPYARFQSAMFDRNTLIISYDEKRGEPRGHRSRREDPAKKGLGSCIDCTLCVQVCPTGIDIREGLQYQCIGCAACVDICDQVMEKMSYPKGLIRYTTLNALESGVTHLLRPKVILYGGVLLAVMIMLIVGLWHRPPVELDILRDRNVLYRVTDQGWIENIYTLKILNKHHQGHRFRIEVEGVPGARVDAEAGHVIASGEVADIITRVQIDPTDLQQSATGILFRITSKDDPSITHEDEARFLKPE